ncbi:MAG: FtsX-like permease family protein [Anaerolineales bacterium]
MDFISLLLRRSSRYWQILLTLLLGVLLSAALLASGPLLIQTVLDAALPYALRGEDGLDGNVQLSLSHAAEAETYATYRQGIEELAARHLQAVDTRLVGGGASAYLYPWIGGQLLRDQRVNLAFYDAAPGELAIVQGEWPETPAVPDEIPVAVGEGFAQAYGLQIGARLPVSLRNADEAPQAELVITAIVRPSDPLAAQWSGIFNPLREKTFAPYTLQYSVLVPQETFFSTAAWLLPGLEMESAFGVLIDPASLRSAEAETLKTQVAAFQAALPELGTRVVFNSRLEERLAAFQQQAGSVKLPLYFLTLEVLLLALYYVIMIAGLYVRQVEGEFARLGSRGASTGQVFRLQLTEAGLLALFGLLLGPLLALGLVQRVGGSGALANILSLLGVRASLPLASWGAAGLGGVVLVVALLGPAVPAVRRGVVVHLQNRAREERPPIWQRLYLDVLLLAGALILLWRVQVTGGFAQMDWLLLIAPLALLIGAATILLRLLPPILRLLARLTARGRGLALPLAMRQAARSPNHIARLVLLLTLTMALGILASGLSATLDLSEQQRAAYAAGSDLRVAFDGFLSPGLVSTYPQTAAAAGVWRGPASINVRAYRSFPSFEVLAIEPYAFADVARFRADFAESDMGYLLGELVTDPEQAAPVLPLPGTPQRIGLWLASADTNRYGYYPLDYISVQVKLKTAQDQMLLIPLELTQLDGDPETDAEVWGFVEGTIPELSPDHYPLSLHSIWFRNHRVPESVARTRVRSYSLPMDDLSVAQPGEDFRVVESFEQADRIWQANHEEMSARFSRRGVHRSGEAGVIIQLPNSNSEAYAFMLANTDFSPDPLPALVSPGFLEATGLQPGDDGLMHIMGTPQTFTIKGVVDYFPTLYEADDQYFLITAYTPLLNRLNGQLDRPVNLDEIWVRMADPAQAGLLVQQLPGIRAAWDVNGERLRIRTDPLSLGLRSLTSLGTLVTFILSLVGFVTYFVLSARQRLTTYGILRSLGISPGQLYGALLIEQVILIAAGISLGVLLGLLLNAMILPDLPVALGGGQAVPPFIPQENWTRVLRLIAGLSLAYLGALLMGALLLWHTQIHRVLRIGEE